MGGKMGGGVRVKKLLKERYRQLGGWTFRQVAVLLLFFLLVLLWFTRDPQFITGWGELFTRPGNPPCRTAHQMVDDASPALLVVFLLFVLPSELNFWPWVPLASSRSSPALLDWRTVHDRFPWGVALLFGGGFALAEAASQSGLSSWVGEQLTVLAALPPWALVLVVCVLTATVTEVNNDDRDNTSSVHCSGDEQRGHGQHHAAGAGRAGGRHRDQPALPDAARHHQLQLCLHAAGKNNIFCATCQLRIAGKYLILCRLPPRLTRSSTRPPV